MRDMEVEQEKGACNHRDGRVCCNPRSRIPCSNGSYCQPRSRRSTNHSVQRLEDKEEALRRSPQCVQQLLRCTGQGLQKTLWITQTGPLQTLRLLSGGNPDVRGCHRSRVSCVHPALALSRSWKRVLPQSENTGQRSQKIYPHNSTCSRGTLEKEISHDRHQESARAPDFQYVHPQLERQPCPEAVMVHICVIDSFVNIGDRSVAYSLTDLSYDPEDYSSFRISFGFFK